MFIQTNIAYFLLDPPVILEPCNSCSVAPDENVTFKCSFHGQPLPNVKWFKDDKEIKDAGKFIIETKLTVSILDIAEVNGDDCGEYRCQVTNIHGQSECKARLNVVAIDGKLYMKRIVIISFL